MQRCGMLKYARGAWTGEDSSEYKKRRMTERPGRLGVYV